MPLALTQHLQVEEFLKELVFDYENEGIEKVYLKLRRAILKLHEQDVDPSSFSSLLRPFDLKAQVQASACYNKIVPLSRVPS